MCVISYLVTSVSVFLAYLMHECPFIIAVNLGEEDQNAYDINKLKKPVNGNIPGMDGKTLSEADTLLVRGKINAVKHH